jgi:N-acylglucosamine 2-epimerase
MTARQREQLRDFYREHLLSQLLPFWLERAIDTVNGGIYTCYDNSGTTLVSTDKFTWSQGRFVWLGSRLASMSEAGYLPGSRWDYRGRATATVDFLKRHVFLEDGTCAFLLTAEGRPKEFRSGEGLAASIFADCFVVLGFAEYARAFRDEETLGLALRTYHTIRRRLYQKTFPSEPYPLPKGCTAHAFPMIMLNVSHELADALEALGHAEAAIVRRDSQRFLAWLFESFHDEQDVIHEVVCDRCEAADSLLCRHLNPGHMIECMWFVLKHAVDMQLPTLIDRAASILRKAFALGWDATHGGLLRYVDRDGGQPRGSSLGGRFEKLVQSTWSTKLWWPHSEALYATLFAHSLTKDERFLDLHQKTHAYTFRVFPNPEPSVGEWIQIRDRQGRPLPTTVALPVKDPFHTARSLLLCIALLSDSNTDTDSSSSSGG